MSSNLDVIRSIYCALAVGDIPSVLGALSPAIHWTEAEDSTAVHQRPLQP